MIWVQWGKTAKKYGNYSVAKASVKGVWIYELWQILPPVMLSKHKSFKEAVAAYEALDGKTV